MIDFGSFVLAQADEHHLHQAAFDIADEIGVRLDPIADQHVVGAEGMAIEMDVETLGRLADDDRLHAGANRTAAERFGHAVRLEHRALALGRAAAVAAHGRHDERLGAQALERVDNGLGDHVDVGDAAAAHGDGHALPGLDRVLES